MTYKSILKVLKRPQKALKANLLSRASWADLLFCFCFSVCSFKSHPKCCHLLNLIKNSVKCLIIKSYSDNTFSNILNPLCQVGTRRPSIFEEFTTSTFDASSSTIGGQKKNSSCRLFVSVKYQAAL